MAVKTGRATTVYLCATTTTAMTAEATTDVGGAHTIYQITDAEKRRISPWSAVTVLKDGSPATATDYTIDYPLGKITFSTPLTTEVVTVTGYYMTETTGWSFRNVSVDMGCEKADASYFGDTAARMIPTIPYCRVTLDHVLVDDSYIGTVKGFIAHSIVASAVAGTIYEAPLYAEISLGGSSEYLRGFFHLSQGESIEADHKALLSGQMRLDGVIMTPTGRTTEQCLWALS